MLSHRSLSKKALWAVLGSLTLSPAVLLIGCCEDKVVPPLPATSLLISVFYLDVDHSLPLENVKVYSRGYGFNLTDSIGEVFYESIKPGNHLFTFETHGWAAKSEELTCDEGKQNEAKVEMKVLPPYLLVFPRMLDFGKIHDSLSFTIRNGGGGIVDWLIWPPGLHLWTEIEPMSDTVSGQNEDTVTMTVDREQIDPGEYIGSFEVITRSDTISMAYRVWVPDTVARIRVSPSELDFGIKKMSLVLRIWNAGADTLHWTIEEIVPWIASIDPYSGSTTTDSDLVTITITREGLTPGDYEDQLKIVSNDPAQDTSRVPIRVEVQ